MRLDDTGRAVLLSQLIEEAKAQLCGDESDVLIRLLSTHILGVDRTAMIVDPGREIDPGKAQRFRAALAQCAGGMPVYRAIGMRPFHGLDLALNEATLEPRDDSEALVELVLEQVSERRHDALKIADLGTGTGAIGLGLLSELPRTHGVLSDVSPRALEAAHLNAVRAGLSQRATLVAGSWCEPLAKFGRFDAIVSNPPYIDAQAMAVLDPSVRDHDPALALFGGDDGLDAYRVLLGSAGPLLRPDGLLALEIGYDQRTRVANLAESFGWREVGFKRDLGGHVRALAFRPFKTLAA